MPRYSTTATMPTYRVKNARGASFKTVPKRNDESDSGGSKEVHKVAKRLKIHESGPGKPNGPGPHSYEKKNHRKASFKTVEPRGVSDGGAGHSLSLITSKMGRKKHLDAWARGARKTY